MRDPPSGRFHNVSANELRFGAGWRHSLAPVATSGPVPDVTVDIILPDDLVAFTVA